MPPESLPEALAGRFASLVHIMKGRWSLFSRLGVLELDGGLLSLRDADGAPLFAVPAAGTEARPHRRRLAVHQVFFKVLAGERWWYLVAHAPNNYQRRSTRELVERYQLRELAPQPLGMDEAFYLRSTNNPTMHQMVWAACWLQAVNIAAQRQASWMG
jgi:hypothetical protein